MTRALHFLSIYSTKVCEYYIPSTMLEVGETVKQRWLLLHRTYRSVEETDTMKQINKLNNLKVW